MSSRWYSFETDARGVETTRFDLPAGVCRTGARGTRLFRQLEGMAVPDGALREIADAAAAWVPHSPQWVINEPNPAQLKNGETGIKIAHLLRAIGCSWDEAKQLATHYRKGTADLSERSFDLAAWPGSADTYSTAIAPEHRVVLIRIPRAYRAGMTAEALYEATRKWWRTNPNRHDAEYAFSVVGGKVLAVYRITDWERESGGRWALQGIQDAPMEERYVGADVSEYLPRGAANPISYVNC